VAGGNLKDPKKRKDLSANGLEDIFNQPSAQNPLDKGIGHIENYANSGGENKLQEIEDFANQSSPNEQTKNDENFSGIRPSPFNQQPGTQSPMEKKNTNGASGNGSSGPYTASQYEHLNNNDKKPKDQSVQTSGGLVRENKLLKNAKTETRGFLYRRRHGLVGILIAGGLFGLGSILQGPLQFVHFAELLDQFHAPFVEDQDVSAATRMYRFLRNPNNPENRRLSILGNKQADAITDIMGARGIELDYSRGANNRLGAISIDPSDTRTVNEFREEFGDRLTLNTETGRLELTDLQTRDGRKAIDVATRVVNQDIKNAGVLGKRRLRIRAGVNYRWLGDVRSSLDDKFSFEEFRQKVRESRQSAITDGVDARVGLTSTYTDSDGTIRELNPEIEAGSQNANSGDGIGSEKVSSGRTALAAGGVGIIGGLCLAQGISSQIDSAHFNLVWLQSMRMAAKGESLGSQFKASDPGIDLQEAAIDAEQFNLKEESYTVKDEDGKTITIPEKEVNWTASAKLKDKLGEEGGIQQAEDTVPRLDATSDPISNFISNIPGLQTTCDFVNGPAGFFIDIVDGGVISALIETAAGPLLSNIIDMAVRGYIGQPIPFDIAGPGYWDVADVGKLLSNNEDAYSKGALKISEADEAKINGRALEEQRNEYAQKPFFARIFDIKEPRSLVAQLLIRNNYSENPVQYGGRAIAAIMPDQIIKPFSGAAYAGTTGITSVAQQYNGLYRVAWTDEEIEHSQSEEVNNDPCIYDNYIFRDNPSCFPSLVDTFDDHNKYREYSSEFAEQCYGMIIEEDGSVRPSSAVGARHPEDERKADFCQGTTNYVLEKQNDERTSLEAEKRQVARDAGWTSAEIGADSKIVNGREINMCQINSRTSDICEIIRILHEMSRELTNTKSDGVCVGVFYRDYSDPWHNPRQDKEKFPPEDHCYKLPGERFHQNLRIYLRDMGALQEMSCLSSADDNACEDIGLPSGSNPGASAGSGVGLEGLTCPSQDSLETRVVSGFTYYKMPEPPNDEYFIYSNESRRYGQYELICVLYSVGLAYHEAYPNSQLYIGDLNAAGHNTHNTGHAVDVLAQGSPWAASYDSSSFSAQATIDLGKLFVDTGLIDNIWWCDRGTTAKPSGVPITSSHIDGQDGTTRAILNYAEEKGTPINSYCIANHRDHFHVDLNIPDGPEHTP